MTHQTFENITEIVIEGSGNFSIDDDGTIHGAKFATESSRGVLKLSGVSNTNVFVGNSFGVIGNVFGSGNVISGNGSVSVGGNTAIINGRRIDLSRLDEISTEEEEEGTFSLGVSCKISNISVTGSANLGAVHQIWLHKRLNINVMGSGGVRVPNETFDHININVSGSGDVCGPAKAKSATINVAGSGNVSNIHILQTGMVSVMGCGDVDVTANNPRNVITSKMGLGTIRVS